MSVGGLVSVNVKALRLLFNYDYIYLRELSPLFSSLSLQFTAGLDLR
jgi:hypothetical protein